MQRHFIFSKSVDYCVDVVMIIILKTALSNYKNCTKNTLKSTASIDMQRNEIYAQFYCILFVISNQRIICLFENCNVLLVIDFSETSSDSFFSFFLKMLNRVCDKE